MSDLKLAQNYINSDKFIAFLVHMKVVVNYTGLQSENSSKL